MPFDDPLVEGEDLVRNGIQSPDYVAGVSGWRINRSGDAEFNDVTMRGTLLGDMLQVETPYGVWFRLKSSADFEVTREVVDDAGEISHEAMFQLWSTDGSAHVGALQADGITFRTASGGGGKGSRQSAFQLADQAAPANSTAYVAANWLDFNTEPEAVYSWRAALWVNSAANNAGDLSLRWSLPAGTVAANWGVHAVSHTVASGSGGTLEAAGVTEESGAAVTSAIPVGCSTATMLVICEGFLVTGPAAGSVRLQFGQLAANAAVSRVLFGSKLEAWREDADPPV